MTSPVQQDRPGVARQIVFAAIFLAAVAVVAVLGSLANAPNTDGWYAEVEKAPWSPPNWLFGPVWSLLYLLIALAGWLIWRRGHRPGRANVARGALTLFIVQLVLNALWSPVFFALYPVIGEPSWWIALVIIVALIISVVWVAIASAEWSRVASWIMVPYLAWLLFATSLNVAIIALN